MELFSELPVFPPPGPYRRRPRGHDKPPGTGPAFETCGSCRNLIRRCEGNRVVRKCWLMNQKWNRGISTCVRVRDAACSLWEEK